LLLAAAAAAAAVAAAEIAVVVVVVVAVLLLFDIIQCHHLSNKYPLSLPCLALSYGSHFYTDRIFFSLFCNIFCPPFCKISICHKTVY